MDPSRKVEMIRIPLEEHALDKDTDRGRDVRAVFPNKSRKAILESDNVKELLKKNRQFVSETTLTEPPADVHHDHKPLAQVLKEQKEAKELQFQQAWKQMKTGKNQPLGEDEVEFLDSLADSEKMKRKRVQEEEERELASFHAAALQARQASVTFQTKKPAPGTKSIKKQKQLPASIIVPKKDKKPKLALLLGAYADSDDSV